MTLKGLLLGVALLFVASCGGGGGGGSSASPVGGTSPAPAPAPAPISEAEASRFLAQASFGATTASINAVRQNGINAYITAQIATPRPTQTHLAWMDRRLTELRATNANANVSANQFYESWWSQSVTADDQLRQRVTFALSQIFVISLVDGAVDPRGAASYYDMLSTNALGNYRTLLGEVTRHPQMGRYLTYLANEKEDANGTRTPDENYAREVMQLMSLGLYELNEDGSRRLDANAVPLPAYTQADISGLARVFTGLSWWHPTPTRSTFFGGNLQADAVIRPMIFYPEFHSTSAKTFLGTTIPASTTVDADGDLNRALDTIANHPNVGPFMSTRLIKALVTSNPSPAYIRRVTTVWNDNGSGQRGDLAAVVRAILTDAEARSSGDNTYGKLREPVISTAHFMRAFGATSVSGNWLITNTSSAQSLGQTPLASPSVFNFWRPGFIPPGTTQLGSRFLSAPEFQVVSEVSVAGYVNTMQSITGTGFGTGNDVRSAYATELPLADNATTLIDRIDLLLFANTMPALLRTRVSDAVNSIAIPSGGTTTQAQIDTARLNRVRTAVLLSMSSPEYLVQR
jgi:uncharacterized protein (DUF1800 family)